MIVTTITITIILIVSVIINIFLFSKISKVKKLKLLYTAGINRNSTIKEEYNKLLKQKVEEIKSIISPKYNKGYYVQKLVFSHEGKEVIFDTNVFILEIDRYINGKSKIKYDYIEIPKLPEHNRKKLVEDYIINNFVSLVETNEIEWLESVNEIQKERENKLKRILNFEKKENI